MKKIIVLVVACFLITTARAGGTDEERIKDCPGKKRAVILGGGGIRGAYQAGAIWYLVNVLGCDFSLFIGTSTGAITAALLSQASRPDELGTFVNKLMENYKTLTGESDIVERRFLGSLRVLLPSWLGGTDGIYNLRPLALRLSEEIDPERVKNLRVLAFSLQSGRIVDQKPYSIRDLIIGSASIPLAVDPAWVRFWIPAIPIELEGNRLILFSRSFPGLTDSDCQIRFQKSWTLPCYHLETTRVEEMEMWISWRTALILPTLSGEERSKLLGIIKQVEAAARQKSYKGEFDPSRIDQDKIFKELVEFTTYHQIVDGGLTDNVPLWETVFFLLKEDYQDIDTLFVLLTSGNRWISDNNTEVKGGLNIARHAFEGLWNAYQGQTFTFNLMVPIIRTYFNDAAAWIRAVEDWRNETKRQLGPGVFEKLEASIAKKYPSRKPLISRKGLAIEFIKGPPPPKIFIVEPELQLFSDSFDVRPEAIRRALYHGCAVAARTFSKPFKFDEGVYKTFPIGFDHTTADLQEPLCDQLKPPSQGVQEDGGKIETSYD